MSLPSETLCLLVDQGREVVVVMHSYSGLPGGEALKGFGKKERQGLEGGVILLVFVMAWIVPVGFQILPKGTPLTKFVFLDNDVEVSLTTTPKNFPLHKISHFPYAH